jgi:ribonuclease HI
MIEQPNIDNIKIWQQNVRKSLTAQLATLHSVEDKYDIICIQEPYFDFQHISRATGVWTSVYPTGFKRGTDDAAPRALTLVHTRLSTNCWTQIPMDSLDVVAIRLLSDKGSLNLYNIYNDCTHSNTVRALGEHMENRERDAEMMPSQDLKEEGDVWLGDFNRHNPWWEDPRNVRLFTNRNLDDAQILIDLLSEHNMDLALPPAVPTIRNSRGNLTRPDNVFISEEILNWISVCEVLPDLTPPNADHFPIVTHLDFPVTRPHKNRPWNFRATDWALFKKELAKKLENIPIEEQLQDEIQIDAALQELEEAILNTMEETVPRSNPSPYAKRWWNKELEAARIRSKRLAERARKFSRFPHHSCHREAKKARNEYNTMIHKSKQQHWDNWLENISSKTLWDTHRFISAPATDGSKTRIPALKVKDAHGAVREVFDNEGKSRALHEVFFYAPPDDFGVDPHYQYPEPLFDFEEVTNEQIERVASSLNPYKAPGLNGISNSVLTHCGDILAPYLGPIYRATFNANYYPKKWKKYKTVVLRKPGKPDYTIPNAYRPIALLDVLAKLLSACVKEIWEFHVERLNLLPHNQFGGRKGRTATDAVHALVNFAKNAWRRKQEVVILFLDIKGAFPNVAIPVLVHDMRKLGFHIKYTSWITNKTTDRETVLAFDDFISQPFKVVHGLDQGCNLSPFKYNCYSSEQMKALNRRNNEMGNTYADDGVCAVRAQSLEEAGEAIVELFKRDKGPKEWGKSHHSLYDLAKSGGLVVTRKRMVDLNNPRKRIKQPPLTIKLDDQHHIITAPTQKYLGVIIDSELRFKEHAAFAIGKGTKWANQFRRLTKVAKGVKGGLARRVYYGAAVASMLYAVDVWCAPSFKEGRGSSVGNGMSGVVKKLESIQRKAAIQATGSLRTAPSDALFAHADMIPMRHLIRAHCQRAATRLATFNSHHPLFQAIQKATHRYPKRHASPLHDILHISKINSVSLETIDPHLRHPCWKPPFDIIVPPSKEEACEAERHDEADIKIYSDGSGKDGSIGAAAIMKFGFRVPRTARFHLGSDDKHTVFEGECIGQLLGVRLLQSSGINLNGREVSLGIDSQSAIIRHNARSNSPASYIIDEIHKIVYGLTKAYPRLKLTLRWTPGHVGLVGNEEVDVEAKKAAGGSRYNVNSNFGILRRPLPISRSAHRQSLRDEINAKYQREFRQSAKYQRFIKIDPSMPSNKYRKLIVELPRRFASTLTQLRTNHVPLQAYLHKFKLADSPICPHCEEAPETVTHFIMFCPKFAAQRRQLRISLGQDVNLDLSVLGDNKHLLHLFYYIKSTDRFEQTFGDLDPATAIPSNI